MHKFARCSEQRVGSLIIFEDGGCKITENFWVLESQLLGVAFRLSEWKCRIYSLLRTWFLQAFQSEILVEKLVFWQCFWVSRKASNFAPWVWTHIIIHYLHLQHPRLPLLLLHVQLLLLLTSPSDPAGTAGIGPELASLPVTSQILIQVRWSKISRFSSISRELV